MPKIKTKNFTPDMLAYALYNAIDNDHIISMKDVVVNMTGANTFTVTLCYAKGFDVMKRLIVTVTEEK